MPKTYLNTTEQVQRTDRAASENSNSTVHAQHRRHNSLSGRTYPKSVTKAVSITDVNQKLDHDNSTQYDPITTLPDRVTGLSCQSQCQSRSRDSDEVDGDETRRRRINANAKDGVLESTTSYDEPDHLQHRFVRTTQSAIFNSRHGHDYIADNSYSDPDGCISGLSSAFSSACPSTVSSPLSTPTRLSPHLQQQHQQQQQEQHEKCCTKSIVAPVKNSYSSASADHYHQQQQHNNSLQSHHLPEHNEQNDNDHEHHQQHCNHHKSTLSSFGSSTLSAVTATVVKSGSKNLKKFDPRLGPSPYRQLLPIALCILSFATVFSILIVYMDTTGESKSTFKIKNPSFSPIVAT